MKVIHHKGIVVQGAATDQALKLLPTWKGNGQMLTLSSRALTYAVFLALL